MYSGRISRLAKILAGLNAVAVISPSSDMFYLTGLRLMADERLTACIIRPDGPAEMILPALYSEQVARSAPRLRQLVWTDGENPYTVLAARLREMGLDTVLVDEHMWCGHLLALQSALPEAEWGSASIPVRQLRRVKDSMEIAELRRAAEIIDSAVMRTIYEVRPGMTERHLAEVLESNIVAGGGEGVSFPPLVGSGPNSALPHYQAGDRVIREGDPVVIDAGCVAGGYCSDTTRTVLVGREPEGYLDIYRIVLRAYQAALASVRPGVACREIDRVARGVIGDSGYGQHFIHRTGHGIGLDVHEEPFIVEGNGQILEVGMTFSIEPGIYLPGRFGARVEDIILVTETGGVSLNTSARELMRL